MKITKKQSGERIDKFLAKKLKKFSRSQLQKLIKEGNITVNDKKISPHYQLKTGDSIKIVKMQTSRAPIKNIELVTAKRPEIEIIDDAPEYIVINKPAGLITHGAPHIQEKTLADLILKKYPQIKKVGDDPNRPGIIHRLDKEVSGLAVIAKTSNSFSNLKKQFKERLVKKEYIALVYGKIKKDSGEINFPIKRAASGHKMAAVPLTTKGGKNIEGRRAVTEFEVMKRYLNYTLVKLTIKTGRTHQIRTHLAAYGHPVVGDSLYGTKKTRELNKKLGLGRIFLVAVKLSFLNLKGEKKDYKIDLSEELKNLLKTIK
jgi:23S rRNA pseudouridine1911/1915/1917 synthase